MEKEDTDNALLTSPTHNGDVLQSSGDPSILHINVNWNVVLFGVIQCIGLLFLLSIRSVKLSVSLSILSVFILWVILPFTAKIPYPLSPSSKPTAVSDGDALSGSQGGVGVNGIGGNGGGGNGGSGNGGSGNGGNGNGGSGNGGNTCATCTPSLIICRASACADMSQRDHCCRCADDPCYAPPHGSGGGHCAVCDPGSQNCPMEMCSDFQSRDDCCRCSDDPCYNA